MSKRVVVYNPKTMELRIAEMGFYRKNIYREIIIVSINTDNFFIRTNRYMNKEKWELIGDYY